MPRNLFTWLDAGALRFYDWLIPKLKRAAATEVVLMANGRRDYPLIGCMNGYKRMSLLVKETEEMQTANVK